LLDDDDDDDDDNEDDSNNNNNNNNVSYLVFLAYGTPRNNAQRLKN